MLKHVCGFVIFACVGVVVLPSQAAPVDAIWHCSKSPSSMGAESEQVGDFGMASANGTIAVTLDDLLAVYSGYPIRIARKPLIACFMPGDEALSLSALKSMELSSPALQILARRSAIVQRQLRIVTDEGEMRQCMTRHFPAFGYLSEPYVTDKVAPCF